MTTEIKELEHIASRNESNCYHLFKDDTAEEFRAKLYLDVYENFQEPEVEYLKKVLEAIVGYSELFHLSQILLSEITLRESIKPI